MPRVRGAATRFRYTRIVLRTFSLPAYTFTHTRSTIVLLAPGATRLLPPHMNKFALPHTRYSLLAATTASLAAWLHCLPTTATSRRYRFRLVPSCMNATARTFQISRLPRCLSPAARRLLFVYHTALRCMPFLDYLAHMLAQRRVASRLRHMPCCNDSVCSISDRSLDAVVPATSHFWISPARTVPAAFYLAPGSTTPFASSPFSRASAVLLTYRLPACRSSTLLSHTLQQQLPTSCTMPCLHSWPMDRSPVHCRI